MLLIQIQVRDHLKLSWSLKKWRNCYNSPLYIDTLDYAEELKRNDVILWPREIFFENSNDNSTAKIFKKGHFIVLSLGDLESYEISRRIISSKIIQN